MTKQTANAKGGFVDTRQGIERRRIVVAEKDPRQRERLRHTLFELGLDIAGLAGDGQEAVQMTCLLAPDFVLLDDGLPVLSALEAASAIRAACPDVASILMTEREGPALLHEAMRSGIRDVVRKPLDLAEFGESLARFTEIRKLQNSAAFRTLLDPSQLPSVYCVTGGKGGVGKTMLATNLALALRHKGEKTVLIDLYTQFGDVASALNMKPQRTLAELAPMVDDIDWALLSRYVHEHQSGLHVMFGSDRPLPLDAITVPCLDRIINVLKREYKYIVFDTPPYLHATTLHALSLANAVMLVCNLFDYTTIADTKQLFDTLDGAYVSKDRLKLVVNRVNAQNKFRLEDVERTFGHDVFAQVPNEPKVVALLNTGYPSHEGIKDTALGESMRSLRDSLTNPGGPRPALPLTTTTRKQRGVFSALKAMFIGAG
ncbi:MAG TPA: AAA family ATPase [Armatimonadota bacterium]